MESHIFAIITFVLWTIIDVNTCQCAVIDLKQDPIVCVNNGCLKGITLPSYKTDSFEAFLGVPFAEPPIGKLRFSNPIPAKNWTGIIDAQKPKSECVQKNYLIPNPPVTGSEDCLYLNVYRPHGDYDTKSARLPVMVFIHGGAFFAGSPNPIFHGPHYFMDTGEVILVLMAYRLGALGFLSTGDESSPGNFGLKDQTLALKWVQENIESFGGDSKSVTIFGVSAGGASVHMHMLSPLSQNLFHRAIVMSGNAMANYNEPHEKPLALARKQAELVGIKNASSMSKKNLIKELRKVDAAKLINSGDGLRFWSVDPLTVYRPVIEARVAGAFLTQDPTTIMKSANYYPVPWMTGVVQNEGAVRAAAIVANKTLLADFNSKFNQLLPKMVTFQTGSQQHNALIVKRLKEFYLNKTASFSDENAQAFIDIMSDSAFLYPHYKSIQTYIRNMDTEKYPVYLYRFLYKGPISYSAIYTQTLNNYGVVHLDDTLYLFHSEVFPEFSKDSGYAAAISTMIETYVEFAKTGKPTVWSPFEPCTKQHTGPICDYQEFRNSAESPDRMEVRTGNAFDLEMVELWDELS